jgi:hypothetical protein
MILVDSPGFDDSARSDVEILEIIGLHLRQGSKEKKLLTGVIYMQRITDIRMQGPSLRYLRLLKALCGADHYTHIALVTSHWDKVAPAEGDNREKQLCTEDGRWGEMIRNGATVNRYLNSTESAIEILRQFLHSPLELGPFGDTAAGKEVFQILLGKLREYDKQISKLVGDYREANFKKDTLEAEIRALEADMGRLRRERERRGEGEREIKRSLKSKENLLEEANAARKIVESEIQQLKAAVDILKQEREKVSDFSRNAGLAIRS